jgi:hypothetical protein
MQSGPAGGLDKTVIEGAEAPLDATVVDPDSRSLDDWAGEGAAARYETSPPPVPEPGRPAAPPQETGPTGAIGAGEPARATGATGPLEGPTRDLTEVVQEKLAQMKSGEMADVDADDGGLARTALLVEYPVLVVKGGRGAGEVFEVKLRGITTIGRGLQNDIALSDDTVSTKHCQIHCEGMLATLTDRGSCNGTLINGERLLLDHTLEVGDVITVGETELEFQKRRRRG